MYYSKEVRESWFLLEDSVRRKFAHIGVELLEPHSGSRLESHSEFSHLPGFQECSLCSLLVASG